ncbi:MAG: hypothetical protein II410_02985 [Ruminococcus sp.]|nr:hypothetical protein [Ruminococcus sp.]
MTLLDAMKSPFTFVENGKETTIDVGVMQIAEEDKLFPKLSYIKCPLCERENGAVSAELHVDKTTVYHGRIHIFTFEGDGTRNAFFHADEKLDGKDIVAIMEYCPICGKDLNS